MSISAIINGEVFGVHGGLSPDAETIDSLDLIDRFKEVPSEGVYGDLLWSDPTDDTKTWALSYRGAGYVFGEDTTKKFNHINKIGLICRSHQLVKDGYQYWFENRLITVWSAPNYCYYGGNSAIGLNFDKNLNKTINIFEAVAENKKAIATESILPYFL